MKKYQDLGGFDGLMDALPAAAFAKAGEKLIFKRLQTFNFQNRFALAIRYFLLAFLLLFLGQSAYAQKSTVYADLRYYPIVDRPVYGASIGYFRQVAPRRELGLRFAITGNDPIEQYPYPSDPALLLANLDITNRWTLSKTLKSGWFAEAGLSMLMMRERRAPYRLECGTGLTPDELARLVEYVSHYHQNTRFSPGLSSAIAWEYAVTKKLVLGLNCLGNLYFLESDNYFNFLLMPSLHSAYRF